MDVPKLTIETTDGPLDLSKAKKLILYFYPKDDTPGCTTQACGLRDVHERIKEAGWSVLGVSPDSLASHERFIEKHDLTFPLGADEDHRVAEAFGVWVEKSMYGRRFMGVERTTFAISDGKILERWEKVKPADHADQILAWIR